MRYKALIGEKDEYFDELPFTTYFMYGMDSDSSGNAMLFYTDHRGNGHVTPIIEVSTGKPYKRPEYAGLDLKDITNFKG
jgi:hypothetical protein